MENKQFKPGDVVRWTPEYAECLIRINTTTRHYNNGPFVVIANQGGLLTTDPPARTNSPKEKVHQECFVLDTFLSAVRKVARENKK